jgi:hypothetical protein
MKIASIPAALPADVWHCCAVGGESGRDWNVYGAAPKYIFEVAGARGGEIPDHDEKSRFTVELAAAGDGNILPYFIVINSSAPSGSNPHDFSDMRVIHNLHSEPAFQ